MDDRGRGGDIAAVWPLTFKILWDVVENCEWHCLIKKRLYDITDTHRNLEESRSDCVVSTVPADSLALNTLWRRQNGCHCAADIFRYIFLNENVWILINISLKFVPNGQIDNISALDQIMAWGRPSDKSLSEPMPLSLLMHKCVTWPQWV